VGSQRWIAVIDGAALALFQAVQLNRGRSVGDSNARAIGNDQKKTSGLAMTAYYDRAEREACLEVALRCECTALLCAVGSTTSTEYLCVERMCR
jgi:hypothetical protein